jgi:hypothetical protein
MRIPHLTLLATLLTASAFARLPPPSDVEQARAADAAAKAAWSAKVSAFQLCQAQNQAVADYLAAMKKAGKSVQPPAVPACTEPPRN